MLAEEGRRCVQTHAGVEKLAWRPAKATACVVQRTVAPKVQAALLQLAEVGQLDRVVLVALAPRSPIGALHHQEQNVRPITARGDGRRRWHGGHGAAVATDDSRAAPGLVVGFCRPDVAVEVAAARAAGLVCPGLAAVELDARRAALARILPDPADGLNLALRVHEARVRGEHRAVQLLCQRCGADRRDQPAAVLIREVVEVFVHARQLGTLAAALGARSGDQESCREEGREETHAMPCTGAHSCSRVPVCPPSVRRRTR